MLTLPLEVLALISIFSCLFTAPTWKNAQQLLTGAILCTGNLQISNILRVLGLESFGNFSKYHRFLNRAKWNSVQLSKILFGVLIHCLPSTSPILIAVDETIERRKGKHIKAKGCYRDAVRSSHSNVVKCFGLKWECMALLLPLPFSSRPWALPFMTILSPSKQANEAAGKPHRTSIDWTIVMVKLICRWLNKRSWILIGDGAYACLHLAHVCIAYNVTLISRLRLDTQLYEFPPIEASGKRGRKRKKGQRINLKKLAEDRTLDWKICDVRWYGGQMKTVKLFSQVCLWYQAGKPVLPLRYVIVVDPIGKHSPEVFFSTDTSLAMEKIIEYFVLRWNIEVTFEETRAHLGVETQRQWSDKAIARTTPLLMGLFSLITWITLNLKNHHHSCYAVILGCHRFQLLHGDLISS